MGAIFSIKSPESSVWMFKVCVELDVSKPLIDSIWVFFEEDESNVMLDGFLVRVYYDVLPDYCLSCLHLGLNLEACKLKVKGENAQFVKMEEEVKRAGQVLDKSNDSTLAKSELLEELAKSETTTVASGMLEKLVNATNKGTVGSFSQMQGMHSVFEGKVQVEDQPILQQNYAEAVESRNTQSAYRSELEVGSEDSDIKGILFAETEVEAEQHEKPQPGESNVLVEKSGGFDGNADSLEQQIGGAERANTKQQVDGLHKHEEATLAPVLQLDEVMCSRGSEQQSHRLVSETSLAMCQESKEFALKQLVDGFTTPEKKADAPTTTTYATTTRTPSSWAESVEKEEEQAKTISQLDVSKVSEYAKKKIEQIMQEPLYPGRTRGDKTNPRKSIAGMTFNWENIATSGDSPPFASMST
ncbi:hypothetical protein Leryth_022276 [Lithospermum erythrorhizon]|nr:hypothetical protein Leryth_022276 [Lithospermum erythrorhizon]